MKIRLASALSRVTAAVFAAGLAVLLVLPSFGSQSSCVMPTAGTVSGLTLVNDINACNGSILSLYSGASAPSSPTTGMLWFNTTTNFIEQYDGTSWLNLWFVDTANHLTTGTIGGGIVSASISSAATTDIGSVPQPFVTVNGTTPITSFGSNAGVGSVHIIKFSGSLTLTYNATSMILPAGTFNITTQAGDIAFALYLGGGNWQVLSYSPATGNATVNTSFPLGTVLFGDYATVPAKFVYGFGQALTRASFPQYTAAVARAQSGTLASGNATITAIGNTAGFGVGMPVEGSSIGAGCTIASLVANTSITLNNGSCVTNNGSVTVTVFLTGYGVGGSGSTVGVKDCRGRTLAGRDDLGGTAAGRLTSSFFGTATADNSSGGTESFTLALTHLPTGITSANASQAISVNSTANVVTTNPNVSVGGVGTAFGYTSSSILTGINSTGSNSISVTSNNTSGSAHRTVQPTVVSDCIVAVLP